MITLYCDLDSYPVALSSRQFTTLRYYLIVRSYQGDSRTIMNRFVVPDVPCAFVEYTLHPAMVPSLAHVTRHRINVILICTGSEQGECKNCNNDQRCECKGEWKIDPNLQTCNCHPKKCKPNANDTVVCSGHGSCDCNECICDANGV